MKISDIPHDMRFKFGPNLREVPLNKMDMLYGMVYLQRQLNEEGLDNSEKGRLHSLLGTYLRFVGELDESKRHLSQAINIFRELDNRQSVFVNQLRLANTHQWHDDFDTSNRMLTELMETAENDPDYTGYKDYVYEHQGKNLFDQKKYREALDYFHKAWELRSGNRNNDLVEATESAIETCRKQLDK